MHGGELLLIATSEGVEHMKPDGMVNGRGELLIRAVVHRESIDSLMVHDTSSSTVNLMHTAYYADGGLIAQLQPEVLVSSD